MSSINPRDSHDFYYSYSSYFSTDDDSKDLSGSSLSFLQKIEEEAQDINNENKSRGTSSSVSEGNSSASESSSQPGDDVPFSSNKIIRKFLKEDPSSSSQSREDMLYLFNKTSGSFSGKPIISSNEESSQDDTHEPKLIKRTDSRKIYELPDGERIEIFNSKIGKTTTVPFEKTPKPHKKKKKCEIL